MSINITKESTQFIPHSCLVKLQAVYDSLKTAEKKAADLLLKDPRFFASATIVEAAEEAGCSEATLVRLARRLGYSGYPEMKSHLLEGDKDEAVQLYEGISEDDDYDDVVNKVFSASIQALYDTLNVMDRGEYKRAVDALCSAERIVFCGVGDAAAVARSGYQKFIRAGFNVQQSSDPDVQLISASQLKKGDVLVAISYSGRTRTIVDVAKYSKGTEATVISITNFPVSPLAKNSDIVLLTAAFAQHVRGEVVSKRVAALCILESLYVNVLLKKKALLGPRLDRSNGALEVNKL